MTSVQSQSAEGLLAKIVKKSGGRELSALLDQALVSGSNFATNVILARTLSIDDYGIFALAWMSVLFVNSLQWAFIVMPMMSVGPKQEQSERPLYYGSVLMQEIVFSIVCAVAVLVGSIVYTMKHPQWHQSGLGWALGLSALAYLLQEFVRRYLFTTRQSKIALLSDSVSYLTQLPIIWVLAHRSNFTAKGALWVIGATSLLGFVVGFIWFEKTRLEMKGIKQVVVRHWKISRWLAPAATMQWSSGNLFLMAAPFYYGAGAAAVLRAIQNIVAIANVWFLGLENVVPAEASRRLHRSGINASVSYILGVAKRWGLITFLFMLMIALFPEFWLTTVYGARYAGNGNLLRLYSAVYFLMFFAGPLRAGLQALENAAPIFWSYSAMTIFSVAFAGPFAKRLGLVGVMWGLIATQFLFQSIVGVSLMISVKRMRKRELKKEGEVVALAH